MVGDMTTNNNESLKRKTFTADEVAAILGIGRASTYEAIRTGVIPALRFGRRIVVTRATLAELLGEDPS